MRTRHRLVGLLAMSLFAGLAMAQAPVKDEPALKGPPVKDNSLPGQKRTFGEGGKERKAGDRPTPLPVIMKALEALRGEQAGENRLTAEQDAKLKAGFEEFQKSTREYLEKNQEEIATLRSRLSAEDRAKFDQAFGGQGRALQASKKGFKGKAPKNGEKGPDKSPGAAPADEMMNPGESPKPDAEASAKARARLMEIYAGRPKPEDAQAKAWSVLSEAQRKIVQEEVAKLQKDAGKRAARPAGGGALSDLKSKTAEEIMNDPRLPEKLRERQKAMTPEQREDAIKRLKERGVEGLRERRANGGGADKPAPKPSDVNVPAEPK